MDLLTFHCWAAGFLPPDDDRKKAPAPQLPEAPVVKKPVKAIKKSGKAAKK